MTNDTRRLWPFLLMLLLISCNDDGLEIDYEGFDCITNNPDYMPEPIPAPTGSHELTFSPNKTLSVIGDDFNSTVSVIDGRNRVFRFRYQLQSDTDPELRELHFEIEPGIDSFTVSDETLRDINTFYTLSCSCPELLLGTYPMDGGCIVGRRVDANNWQVDINLSTMRGNELVSLMASGNYVKLD